MKINLIFFIVMFFISIVYIHAIEDQEKQLTEKLTENSTQEIHCMPFCLQCEKSINSCTKCQQKHTCCNWACQNCVNQTICTQCQEGFYLDQEKNLCVMQNSCIDQFCAECDAEQVNCIACLPQFYLEPEMHTCNHCLPHCMACIDHSSCTKCQGNYFLNNGVCTICPLNCLQCENATVCQRCINPYFVNQNGKCEKCMQYCLKCTTKDSCDNCTYSTYLDPTTKLCVPCSLPCSLCKSKTQCTSCIENFFFNQTDKTCNSCKQMISHCSDCAIVNNNSQNIKSKTSIICNSCEDGYFYNQNKNICLSCSANCRECIDQTKCIQCTSKFFLNQTKQCQLCRIPYCVKCSNKNSCSLCQSGYYWNQSAKSDYPSCQKCIIGCQFCDSLQCLTCQSGFYKKNGHCYRCNPACARCMDQSSKCTKCLPGYYTVGLMSNCYKCPEPCSQCTNTTYCTGCISGYYLHENICKKCLIQGCDICKRVENQNLTSSSLILLNEPSVHKQICVRCKLDYYFDDDKCIKCMQNCQTCSTSSDCNHCQKGYHFVNSTSACVKCPQNCSECEDVIQTNKTICRDCFQGYYFDFKLQICIKCIDNCEYCIQSMCLKCLKTYYLKNIDSSISCLKCSQPCHQCSEQKQCLTCIMGYYLNAMDKCIKCQPGCLQCNQHGCFICDQKYHLDYVHSTCISCKVDKCLKCSITPEKCLQCEDGYTHHYPVKYEEVGSQIQMCYRCDQKIQGCKSCQSPTLCTECFKGLILDTDGESGVSTCNENHDFVLFWLMMALCFVVISALSVLLFKNRRNYNKLLQKQPESVRKSLIESYSINLQNQLDENNLKKPILSNINRDSTDYL